MKYYVVEFASTINKTISNDFTINFRVKQIDHNDKNIIRDIIQ